MKDICADYRTPVFLWDFCSQEYVRQYDDDITIINAGKQNYAGGPELIFLGFYRANEAHLYQANTAKEKKQHRLYKKTTGMPQSAGTAADDASLRYQYTIAVPSPIIRTFGRVVRCEAINMLLVTREYKLTVKFPSNQVSKDNVVMTLDGKTLKELKTTNKLAAYTEQIKGVKYYKVERMIEIIANEHYVIIDRNFPLDTATTQFEIQEIVCLHAYCSLKH